jgi:hypothetical protein
VSTPSQPMLRFVPWFKRQSLLLYFLLACALTWSIHVPIALSMRGHIATRAPLALHYRIGVLI